MRFGDVFLSGAKVGSAIWTGTITLQIQIQNLEMVAGTVSVPEIRDRLVEKGKLKSLGEPSTI